MDYTEKRQFERMTEKPIPALVLKLAGPTVLSMLVTSVYNIADTYFVSQLGTAASGAVGIVFSLMSVIQAVGFALGLGGGSIISRKLGERKKDDADKTASTAFFTAVASGLLITLFGTLFLDSLLRVLGATESILPYARDYAGYILIGAAIMGSSFVLNNILRAEGRAFFSMIGLVFGGVLNIALDPVFIYVLDMGISGAAVATLISQSISFLILLSFFVFRKSQLTISVKNISRKIRDYIDILSTGLPSLLRQGTAAFAAIALNNCAAPYGDQAIAAFSVTGRVFMLVFSVILGIGQGFQPVAGYNYGAKLYDRVKKALLFTVVTGFVIMSALSAAGYFFSGQIIALFRADDPAVIETGSLALRMQCLALPLNAMSVPVNMLFQSAGKVRSAAFLSSLRQGLFFFPAVFILPSMFGIFGLQIAQPVSDALSAAVCVPFAVLFFRKLKKNK